MGQVLTLIPAQCFTVTKRLFGGESHVNGFFNPVRSTEREAMPEDDVTNQIDTAQVAELLDEMACRKVLGRYGSALDWRDESALASTVWPDAVIDYGFFKGSGEEWVKAFMPIERAAGRPFHILMCEQLEIRSPYAYAESLGLSITRETASGSATSVRQYWGRYLDELHKRGKEWRISKRTYIAHGVWDIDISQAAPGRLEGLYIAENLTVDHPMFRTFR